MYEMVWVPSAAHGYLPAVIKQGSTKSSSKEAAYEVNKRNQRKRYQPVDLTGSVSRDVLHSRSQEAAGGVRARRARVPCDCAWPVPPRCRPVRAHPSRGTRHLLHAIQPHARRRWPT